MNLFSKRRNGPLPLIRDRAISSQAAQAESDKALAKKLSRELDASLSKLTPKKAPK